MKEYTIDQTPVHDPDFIESLEIAFEVAALVRTLEIPKDVDEDAPTDERFASLDSPTKRMFIIATRIMLDLNHYKLLLRDITNDQ